jgi:hypothetical protein
MARKFVIGLLLACLFIFFHPKFLSAQILVNEFSSYTLDDWVEIINISANTIDLSGYVIRDLTDTNKIDLAGELPPEGIVVFDFGRSLNKDGDVIRIISKEGGVEKEAVFILCYGDKMNDPICTGTSVLRVGCIPDSDLSSVGSYPSDGGNTFERFSLVNTSTKGKSNATAELYPCPTYTPTSTPTRLPTSSPTSRMTATATPSIKPTPTPTIARNFSISPSPTPLDNVSKDESDLSKENGNTPAILGLGTGDEDTKEPGNDVGLLPFIFIFFGLVFVGTSIYLFVKGKKPRSL